MNGLKEKLLNSIVNLSATMEEPDLYGSHIYGNIPREIGKLVNMIMLSLDHNFLTGTIPESIGSYQSWEDYIYAITTFLDSFQHLLATLLNKLGLYISNNMIQGSLPTELFNVSTIHTLSLANNRLGGT